MCDIIKEPKKQSGNHIGIFPEKIKNTTIRIMNNKNQKKKFIIASE